MIIEIIVYDEQSDGNLNPMVHCHSDRLFCRAKIFEISAGRHA